MPHVVQWTAPAPMWTPARQREGPDATARFRRPAILRFATDDFMEQLVAMLATDPTRVGELEARPETWRDPLGTAATAIGAPATSREKLLARMRVAGVRKLALAAGVMPTPPTSTTTKPLKLYQPAHQRYYLVSACLVCRLPGLPDRALSTGRQDRATFVVRRLRTVNGATVEYAFMPSVPNAPNSGWQDASAAPELLQPGEEQLPLFALNFGDDTGYRRRLLAGLVPVGKREAYMGAGTVSASTAAASAVQPAGAALDPG